MCAYSFGYGDRRNFTNTSLMSFLAFPDHYLMKEIKKKPGPGAHSPDKVITHHKINPPVFSLHLYPHLVIFS